MLKINSNCIFFRHRVLRHSVQLQIKPSLSVPAIARSRACVTRDSQQTAKTAHVALCVQNVCQVSDQFKDKIKIEFKLLSLNLVMAENTNNRSIRARVFLQPASSRERVNSFTSSQTKPQRRHFQNKMQTSFMSQVTHFLR